MPAPVLLIGAGTRRSHGFALTRLAAARPTVLLAPRRPRWAPGIEHLPADLDDAAAAAAAAKGFAARTPLAGVLALDERYLELAARLAQDLGLPGMTPQAARLCRDAAAGRRTLAAAHVPLAHALVADTEDQAVAHARHLGYPVAVRPRGLGSSSGACRADTDRQVRRAYRQATSDTALGVSAYAVTGCLVEEYLTGTEVSAVTVVHRGVAHVAAVVHKLIADRRPHIETGRLVRARDPLVHHPGLRSAATRAAAALGITTGILDIELRMADLTPRVITVRGALDGTEPLTHLVDTALGIDLAAAAAALAAGQAPDLTPTRARTAAVQHAYPPRSGRVGEVGLSRLHELGRRSAPWLAHLDLIQTTGAYVSAPPLAGPGDRIATWIVHGPDVASCRHRLAAVADRLVVAVDGPTPITAAAR
ncbi:ATP-grasp domain-containing protein [Streptomyces sp. NPDC006984]|uniref:ATP-grasp domain-containing protein n=1 Tax=Streptomyces sp. NPDC006984 TaxID=3155463 RepID=UPI0034116603